MSGIFLPLWMFMFTSETIPLNDLLNSLLRTERWLFYINAAQLYT